MSTSFATSPDSGPSGPHTPPRALAPAKSSLVGKVHKYFLPENREQYQKFGSIEKTFLLGNFDKDTFLKFLGVKIPESVPDVPSRGKKYFLTLANKVAKSIKKRQEFRDHKTLEFKDTGTKSPPGHVTDTKCKPDITAAFKNHWKDGVVPWPFIRLAGETASEGTNYGEQQSQAISYLHYLLLARPDLYVTQGLLSSNNTVIFYFGIGGEGIWQFEVKWEDPELNKLLYAFIYRLYEPSHFADPSYIETEFDIETTAKYTIEITYQGSTKACRGFYPIYARNPFATRTHVLSNPNVDNLTVLKDQLCRVERRFEELTILNEYVHKPGRVPGVVVAAYGEKIELPESVSAKRCKHRLGLEESGSPFTSIPTLSKVLETLFDVLEVLRYLRHHRQVLHRDISSGNVLYIENSSNRSLPQNSVSIEAETTGLPLCYAKHLLGKSENPLETSMLLVDFDLAEHLEDDTRAKGKQICRTGTPLFIARAVELGEPVPAVFARVPGIPNSPDIYAKAHPDRVKKFPSSIPKRVSGQANKTVIDPDAPDLSKDYSNWRHELEHDVESVFWLLLYWAMVVQPEECPKEKINVESWNALNDNHKSRQRLIKNASELMSFNLTHSFYEPLQPLIVDLAAILVNDSHWLPVSDPRKDTFYITEAFQRLILNFIIDNSGKEFMNCCVTKTFRKVHEVQAFHASLYSFFQNMDAEGRKSVNLVGCVCGFMDSCPFL